MKIASYNVGGLQSFSARFGSFEGMLDSFKADIICFQKIKITREKLQASMVKLENYYGFFQFSESQLCSSGVATFCKKSSTPYLVTQGFLGSNYSELDNEGRCLVTDHGDFVLFNVYFPTSGAPQRIAFKMWFCYLVQEMLESQNKKVILAGSLGFPHLRLDHWSPSENFEDHRARQWLSIFFQTGNFCDAFRVLYPYKKKYTHFQNYQSKLSRTGTRIDYFILSTKAANQLLKNFHTLDCNTLRNPIKLTLMHKQTQVPLKLPPECSVFYPEFQSITMLPKKRPTPKPHKLPLKGELMCLHGEQPIVKQVTKPGKNKDRPFYSCRRPPGNSKDIDSNCNFFKWADSQVPKCYHKSKARVKKVQKEGRNQSKWFFKCSQKPPCDFFEWASEINKYI